jgi:hypothetical protein
MSWSDWLSGRCHPLSTVTRRVGLGVVWVCTRALLRCVLIKVTCPHLLVNILVTLYCSMTFMLSPRRLPHGAPAFHQLHCPEEWRTVVDHVFIRTVLL